MAKNEDGSPNLKQIEKFCINYQLSSKKFFKEEIKNKEEVRDFYAKKKFERRVKNKEFNLVILLIFRQNILFLDMIF